MLAFSRKINIDWKLLLSCAIIALMVFVRDMDIIAFGPVHFTAVVFLICFWLPYQKLMAFFFFYISVGIGVHGAAWIPIVSLLIIKSKKYNISQFVFSLLLLLMELFHFVSYTFEVDIVNFVFYALVIIIFFFVLFDDNIDNTFQRNNIKYYISGVVVVSLIVIIHSVSAYGFNELLLEKMRMGAGMDPDEINGGMRTNINANDLACFSMIAFSLILFVKNVYKNNLIKGGAIVVLTFTGILTASRTWLLIMALVLVLYFMLNSIKGKLLFVVIAGILLFLSGMYVTYSEAIVGRFTSRFEESNLNTAGERTIIFADYNQWLVKHPERILYGTGAIYYNQVCQIRYSMHNGTQQILVCYGLIGVLLFAVCIVVYYRKYPKNNHVKFVKYVPFIIGVVFLQAGQFIYPPTLMLPCLAATLPLKIFDSIE